LLGEYLGLPVPFYLHAWCIAFLKKVRYEFWPGKLDNTGFLYTSFIWEPLYTRLDTRKFATLTAFTPIFTTQSPIPS
jgi:hypothetical protein